LSLRNRITYAGKSALHQQVSFSSVSGERRSTFELGVGLFKATKFGEEVTTYARQQVVVPEREF
jgi:hypothetical protein